ncbi:hypothetical protein [Arcobacter sp. CECT 8985]|uniref:hypothetical protein n=1 Tax=Arcobacter sp. CECT 8985 TaxID=1935424 RepID=UPI00100B5355|nr:hypothetical protein [Arcobacter sp. CECT 8985]RXJ87479.1 hypothetical protein CRU93_03990 [Arcobacter sp. CECT 8985]
MGYKSFIKNQTQEYIKFSKDVEARAKNYKENYIEIVNRKNYISCGLTHNPVAAAKDNYLWFLNNCMQMQKIHDNDEYISIFLTLTLDSQYHRYIKKSKRLNKKFKEENTIEKGYKLLNDSFREIYKNFRVNRKHTKIHYCKAIEFTHCFTSHLHAIIFVKKEHLDKLINHIKNIVKKNKLGKEYKIDVIDNIKATTYYVIKYINKEQNNEDENSFHLANGWKKKHRIRAYTFSYSALERYVFKKVNTILNLSKNLKNEVEKNVIDEVLEKCNIRITTKKMNEDKTYNLKIKRYFNDDSKYDVIVNRTRTTKMKIDSDKLLELEEKLDVIKSYKANKSFFYINYQFFDLEKYEKQLEKLENDYNDFYNSFDFFDDEIENKLKRFERIISRHKAKKGFYNSMLTKDEFIKKFRSELEVKTYNYKIDNFTIIDKETNEVIYNKKDYVLFEKLEDKELEEYTKENAKKIKVGA